MEINKPFGKSISMQLNDENYQILYDKITKLKPEINIEEYVENEINDFFEK